MDDPSVRLRKYLASERKPLDSAVSGVLTAPQRLELELELELETTAVSTKAQKSHARIRRLIKNIDEQPGVLERPQEAVKCSDPTRKREAVDTENAILEIEPDESMRSDLSIFRDRSGTAAPGQGEAPYQRKRLRTMPCSDGDDTDKSASQACSQNKRTGSSILVNMTFRETSEHTYICGRQSIVNQLPDWAGDEEESRQSATE
ncbi:hypothetical protein Daus18300_012897 [Diaporthe australafricana]|uniref:Uncharacterized protein n=1 Tax=Diaporthe australafricana TaxID=127596 RepID=A0ABR3W175_9PEZI